MEDDELNPTNVDEFVPEEEEQFGGAEPEEGVEDPDVDLEEGLEDSDQTPRQQSRATARVQASRREVERLQRELEAEREARKQEKERLARETQEARERAHYESLDPLERIEYRQQQQEARFAQIERNNADAADRLNFKSLISANPKWAKHEEEVERMIAAANARGVVGARELALDAILGRQLRSGVAASRAKQVKNANANVDRQRARPVRSGSDVPSSSSAKSEREARMERLRNSYL